MNEILLYGYIYSGSMASLINQIDEANPDEGLTMRINTNGGVVQDCFGLLAKFQEFDGEKKIKIDGKAYSMGAFACLFADEVEALDVSDFMFHRASFGEYYEKSEFFTDEDRQMLGRINANLQKAMTNKIDVAKFEEISGTTIKDLFSMDDRKDVFLTAKQAKQIGLVTKINKITPQRTKKINACLNQISANYDPSIVADLYHPEKIEAPAKDIATEKVPVASENKMSNKNSTKMTKDEFKTNHPELFAEIKNEGVAEEKERIQACLVFNDVDPEKVKALIESGNPIGQLEMAEMTKKMMASKSVEKIEAEKDIKVDNPDNEEKPEGEAKKIGYESDLRAELGLKNA